MTMLLVTAMEFWVDDVKLSYVQQALIHKEQKQQIQLLLLSTSSYEYQTASSMLGGQSHKPKII